MHGLDPRVRVLVVDAVRRVLRLYYGRVEPRRLREVAAVAVEALAKRRVTVYGGTALRLYHEGRSGFYEAVVRIDGSGRCSCPGGVTGHVCKHMLAAWALLALYRVSSAAGQAFPARFYVSEARSLEEGGGPGAEAA